MENSTNTTSPQASKEIESTYLINGMAIGYLLGIIISTLLGSTIGINWIFGTFNDFDAMLELSTKYFGVYGMCLGGIMGLALNPIKHLGLYVVGILTCPASLIFPLSHIDLYALLAETDIRINDLGVAIIVIYVIISLIGIASLSLAMGSSKISNNKRHSVCLAYLILATIFGIAFSMYAQGDIDIEIAAFYYLSLLVSLIGGIVIYSIVRNPKDK